MIHPLIIGNLKDDPMRMLRSGLMVAIETATLLAQIGIIHVSHAGYGQTVIAHWLSNLLAFVFWISFASAVLTKHVDVSERSLQFGVLRILGASDVYVFGFLLQETIIESMPGALLGPVLGYILLEVFGVLLGITASTPIQWWPAVAGIAMFSLLAGAILAIPKAIREGLAEALQ